MEAPVTANELAARRIDELTSKIDKLNDNIKEYDAKIENEKSKAAPDHESIKEWRETIKVWRETIKEWSKDKASLRRAWDLEIVERERASVEKRFSNLSMDDPGFLHFLLFVLGF
jgi:uncharacterized coiled-coil DUF342 family protein